MKKAVSEKEGCILIKNLLESLALQKKGDKTDLRRHTQQSQ